MKKILMLLYLLILNTACSFGQENDNDCGSLKSGSIVFKASSIKLNAIAMASLKLLAKEMRSNPNCIVVVASGGASGKLDQQYSWDRVNATINYMVEKEGIDREHFIFNYGNVGISGTVIFRSARAGENGPNRVPPPFPNLRR